MDSALKRAWPWLEAALHAEDDRPLLSMDDVVADLEARRAHLWVGENAALVTTITDYAQERVIECWLAGGDMKEILAMTPPIEDWARRVGCTQVQVMGRKGWVRALSPQGYHHYATSVRKLLS